MKRSAKLLYWLPAIGLMSLIFYSSSRTSLVKSELSAVTGHFIGYAVLAITYAFALSRTTKLNRKQLLFIPILLAVLYGISDELHQLYTPTRFSDINDVIVDFLGAAVGSYGYYLWNRLLINRTPAEKCRRLVDKKERRT
ncbi:MAG TPA: VanZ family protein [Actinobacteria bacterium]|nr:VanZ family protein [Actinomycetes bacterium]HEX21344.1 VanZ family protein [Actinomycetota bacterium]